MRTDVVWSHLQRELLLDTGRSMSGLLSVLTISYHCIVSTLHNWWGPNLTPPLRISGNQKKKKKVTIRWVPLKKNLNCEITFPPREWTDLSGWSEEARWCPVSWLCECWQSQRGRTSCCRENGHGWCAGSPGEFSMPCWVRWGHSRPLLR